jgi:hypothetical protein
MKKQMLTPVLVEEIPAANEIEPGHLYISHKYGTALHLCSCGCGEEVVTPLSAEGWTLYFNGRFSLRPSIGNFEFPCKSHYFITNEEICWCKDDMDSIGYESEKNGKNVRSRKKGSKKNLFRKLFQLFG